MYFGIILAICWCAVFLPTSNAHSWIACTDYAEKNAGTYDHNLCRGYARKANHFAPRGQLFGGDKGFDHQPSESNPCKTTRDDFSSYDPDHPMAVYYPGQQVVLAHPMKNHGADSCTNRYIPDSGNWIMRGQKDATSDPPLSGFTDLVANLGKTPRASTDAEMSIYPKPGYQNAPRFCDNTDKALGTFSFNVPSNLQRGRYTFLWKWAFNGMGNLYTTCFEVDIVGSVAERDSILRGRGVSNLYEPCGLLTSDGMTMGNSNPGCTPVSGGTPPPPTTTTTAQSTSTTRTVPTTQSTTTTQQPGGSIVLQTLSYQMAGEIILPQAQQGTRRRYLSLHWDCPVEANFWNVRVVGQHNVGEGRRRRKRHVEGVHYDLLQEGTQEINSGKFFYHAMFPQPCDLLAYPPIAKLVRDEM